MVKVLRDLLGEWCLGRLEPRRFALLYAAVIASLAGLIVLIIAWAMTVAKAAGPNWPAGLMFFTFMALLAALFNITVKRGRDIGIPGFVMGIALVILFCMGGVTILLSILLALVPTGTFGRPDSRLGAES